MRRFSPDLLLGFLLPAGLPAPATAFDNDQSSVSLHVTPLPAKSPCSDGLPAPTAHSVNTRACDAPGTDYAVWYLVCNGSDSTGVAGMEFGIDYDGTAGSGIDVWGWVDCMDLSYPSADWPDAPSGLLAVWDPVNHCRNTPSEPGIRHSVIAVGGYLAVTVHSPDRLRVVGRPVTGYVKVVDCRSSETRLDGLVPPHQGTAGFCVDGYNACDPPTPVESRSWGRIKRRYR